MSNELSISQLKLTAAKCRENVIRMVKASGHGHIGGTFSSLDIVTALYFYKMKIDAENPQMENRDRFLLSAGHKSMVQYAVLAEIGFFPKEKLDTYGQLHTKLPGHPDMHKLPGVEANTGALGHGLSIACGMALGLKIQKKDAKVYVIMGDGELPEGSNWEAAAIAAHYNLDNIVVFVDNNGLQISGNCVDVMNMSPIDERFKAFGWDVKEIDGNNMEEIITCLDSLPLTNGKPIVIVAHTIKAKGIPFGENNISYHYWAPSQEELEKADDEIKKSIRKLEKETE